MKTPKCFAQKFQSLIALCFAMTILNFPLWAQETKAIQDFYCPYCGMGNLMTSKFCGVCGSKLPARSAAANFYTKADSASKRFDEEFTFRPQTATGTLMGVGLLAGAEIDRTSSDGYEELDGLYGFVVGAPIGEALLLPVGIHLANGRRGSLPASLLASIAITGAGLFVAIAAEEPAVLLSIPILQLSACTAIERSTGRSQ